MTFSTQFPSFSQGEKDRLLYDDKPIRMRGRMLCLTDMHRADEASTESNAPNRWLRHEDTQRFRRHIFRMCAGTETPSDIDPNRRLSPIWESEVDGLVSTARGNNGGTWAHWQLALSYARYLSPAFAAWGNTVIRQAMEAGRMPSTPDQIMGYLENQFSNIEFEFGKLSEIVHSIERTGADQMFLHLAAQDNLTNGRRRGFSTASKSLMCEIISGEDYVNACPCCGNTKVLDEQDGSVVDGSEFDHFFHCGLNRVTHGWLICRACHVELTHGGYLGRFGRIKEFRCFQDLAQKLEQDRMFERRREALAAKARDGGDFL